MLTTMTASGQHVSRPMALQQAEFDGDLWFFTFDSSSKIEQIQQFPQVNVSFSNQKDNAWVSLAGPAEHVHDRAKSEELWNPLLKAWFPDGLDTKGLTLIKIHAETAEYWDSASSSKALELFGTIKAAVTGKQPDAGENKTVDLQ